MRSRSRSSSQYSTTLRQTLRALTYSADPGFMFYKLNLRYLPGFEIWADVHRSEVKWNQRQVFSEGALMAPKPLPQLPNGFMPRRLQGPSMLFSSSWAGVQAVFSYNFGGAALAADRSEPSKPLSTSASGSESLNHTLRVLSSRTLQNGLDALDPRTAYSSLRA